MSQSKTDIQTGKKIKCHTRNFREFPVVFSTYAVRTYICDKDGLHSQREKLLAFIAARVCITNVFLFEAKDLSSFRITIHGVCISHAPKQMVLKLKRKVDLVYFVAKPFFDRRCLKSSQKNKTPMRRYIKRFFSKKENNYQKSQPQRIDQVFSPQTTVSVFSWKKIFLADSFFLLRNIKLQHFKIQRLLTKSGLSRLRRELFGTPIFTNVPLASGHRYCGALPDILRTRNVI